MINIFWIIDQYLLDTYKATYSPASLMLFDESSDSNNTLVEPKAYLSCVMKLMYLARLTRPDILLSVTYLATKSQCPTRKHWLGLKRVIRYLMYTRDWSVVVRCSSLRLVAYCDASFASHSDGKGHTGYIIYMGNNLSYLHAASSKQKLASLSSTEAEIITS